MNLMLEVGCWMLEVGSGKLGAACWMLELGSWKLFFEINIGSVRAESWKLIKLDVGIWKLEAGCWKLGRSEFRWHTQSNSIPRVQALLLGQPIETQVPLVVQMQARPTFCVALTCRLPIPSAEVHWAMLEPWAML